MQNIEQNPEIRLEWLPKTNITVWEMAQSQYLLLISKPRLSDIVGRDASVMRHFNVIDPSGRYRKPE